MKKRIVALITVLALSATAVFAEPVAVALEMMDTVAAVQPTAVEVDSLFADIEAVAMTETEAEAVDGGFLPPIIPVIVVLGIIALGIMQCTGSNPPQQYTGYPQPGLGR